MSACSKRVKVPLSSLRLLVPPLRLLSAFLWQVAEQRLIKYYTRLEEFVSVVLDMVPDLLGAKERLELLLGLRARFVLELCHDQPSVTVQMLQPHLDRVRCVAESAPIDEGGDQTITAAVESFVDLIQNLLESPTYRELFFQDIYSLHYGPKYDQALRYLVWQFLSRLEELIPVPSFHQAASWLEEDLSPLEDSLQLIYDSKEIQKLLFHFKPSAYLDPGSSPPPVSANIILSTLSISVSENTVVIPRGPPLNRQSVTEQCSKEDVKEEEEESCGDGGEPDRPDRAGDVDGHSPQRHIGQGMESNTNQTHCNNQNVNLNHEPNGHTKDCENPVSNSIEQETPPSPGEGPGRTPLQGSLSETASLKVSTTDATSSHPPLDKVFPTVKVTRSKKTETEEREAPVKSKVDASLSKQPINAAAKGDSRYTCSLCGKAFFYKKYLTQHQKMHPEKPPNENMDDKHSSSKSKADPKLSRHQPNNATPGEELRYKCPDCGKAFFYKKFLTQHLKNHSTEKPHVCSYCGKAFRNKAHLIDHVRLHTGERPFVCPICGKTFTQSASLCQHKRLHTGQRPEQRRARKQETVALPAEGPGGPSKTHGKDHEVTPSERSDHTTEIERPISSSSELKAPASSEEGPGDDFATEPVQQASPNSTVNTVDNGASEKQTTHPVERPHLCYVCGKAFAQKGHLNEHLGVHSTEESFECSECGKSFSKSSYLLRHKRLHTDERPFLCSYCGKSYAFKSSLLNHRCVYQGELPYSCSICGKRFSQSSSVAPHERLHTGERPFVCSVCGKGFTTSGALIVHTRRHTGERPYKCEICGKGYIQSGHLVDHRRSHSGEKPYGCSVCKTQFKTRDSMRRHMKTHTGEKPHECVKCGRRFARKSHVREHQRVHK